MTVKTYDLQILTHQVLDLLDKVLKKGKSESISRNKCILLCFGTVLPVLRICKVP